MTLEQLISRRETLLSARYNGVLTIRAGDKQMTYKTDIEMKAALDHLEREIARVEGRRRTRSIRTVCGKGL